MRNINCGILGHVDSGKTTLSKCLSQIGSTNSFDKNPQSKERGITLDLGFSSFCPRDDVRVTLVDCPGHGSLIKTVIGGASIIDMMILVIDINKGIQAQTAECLVIGEIIGTHIIFVLNKIDSLEESVREKKIKATKKLIVDKLLKNFKFPSYDIVSTSALNGNISELVNLFSSTLKVNPDRSKLEKDEFLMSIDHCFQVKGSGTVFTGTVLSGAVKVNDQVEIVKLNESKKVKTIQIFRESKPEAKCGDRAAICVTQFDSKKVERGLLSSTNLKPISRVVCKINRVKLFREKIKSKTKFNITVGHQTCSANISLFEPFDSSSQSKLDFDSPQCYDGSKFR